MRQCNVCGKEKPLEDFYKNHRDRLGRGHTCKECTKKRARKWYADNREQAIKSHRAYCNEHHSEISEARRAKYELDPEPTRERSRVWRAENRERHHDAVKRYNTEHRAERRERLKETRAARTDGEKTRERARGARYRESHHTEIRARYAAGEAQRKGLLVRGHCAFCGSKENVEGHHRDYSRPLDVTWLCCACHMAWHITLQRIPNTIIRFRRTTRTLGDMAAACE